MLKALILFLALSATSFALAEEPVQLRSYGDAFKMMQKHNAPGIFVFHASWCGPCKQMQKDTWAPLMPKLRKNYIVYFVDVDKEPKVASKWKAISLPAYAIVSEGGKQLVVRGTGYLNKPDFMRWAREGLKKWRKK